jgi:inhibitor of KinA sporulation pathway (predicted exonuclease)
VRAPAGQDAGRILVANHNCVRFMRGLSTEGNTCLEAAAYANERAFASAARFMARHPAQVVVFDTEFTAWAGSVARGWAGPGEHKEVIQIGAVVVDAASLEERRAFSVLIRPVLNPVLSDYLIDLTGITNERLAVEGVDFTEGITRFVELVGSRHLYAYGRDDRIIAANAERLGHRKLWPDLPATNLKDWLLKVGIPLSGVHSGHLAAHVGAKSQGVAHDALVDSRSLAEAVRYLVARGAPNPFAEPSYR